MGYLSDSYRDLNPLKTDLYQLTMSQGYFDQGRQEEEVSFYMHWRQPPFEGGYAIAAGLEGVVDFLDNFTFNDEHIAYLRAQQRNGQRLFSDEFVDYLKDAKLNVDVDAVPEGTVMTGSGPVVRVTGPLWQCQLVESVILNIINKESMIATRAARIAGEVGEHGAMTDSGLRRAATLDTGMARSAFIGGAVATSDVDAGMRLGVPTVGTMAHSWIMGFQQEGKSNNDVELDAFRAYLRSMPNNTILLVDTFDPMQGVRNAIQVTKEMGVPLMAMRLDSGDLYEQSWEAKALIDEAKETHPELFGETRLLASDGLDEYKVKAMRDRALAERGEELPFSLWGIGTEMVNPGPFRGGVYKISARETTVSDFEVDGEEGHTKITRTMKVAGADPEDPTLPGPKSSIPGLALDTLRLRDADGKIVADVIIDHELDKGAEGYGVLEGGTGISMADNKSEVSLPDYASAESLLKPIYRRQPDGTAHYVYDQHGAPGKRASFEGSARMVTDLSTIQNFAAAQRDALPEEVRRIEAPERLPVFLDPRINDFRKAIMAKTREEVPGENVSGNIQATQSQQGPQLEL